MPRQATRADWRKRAGTPFQCEKRPAMGTKGMVVTNHPLASAAGAEILAAGGNAFDAAVGALFTLSVVEPMMVGIFGGGMAHLRFANGRHTVIDGMSTAPLAARPDTYRPVSDKMPDHMETAGRENAVGIKSVAAPGNLKAWCEIVRRFGTFSLADVMEPAIRHASRGFAVSAYLQECASDVAADMARDREISKLYQPGGKPIQKGTRLVQGDYAETLRTIAKKGPGVFYGGALGRVIVDHFERKGGLIAMKDLTGFQVIERKPVRGTYRGFDIVGPPPPTSGGVHVIQMLNILEHYDLARLGFGTPDTLHLLAEALKIAFADRNAATADPAFVKVPVAKLISKRYAANRQARIDLKRAQAWKTGLIRPESANTTHLTVADSFGNVAAMTQTINNLFGSRIIVPGTGIIPNNYMNLFDPHPGHTLSIAPGKRVTSSMSPLMALKNGQLRYALGLPGGLRIFGSAMQALINLIDHGMSLQEAVEAPRVWTQGGPVEVENEVPRKVRDALAKRGHQMLPLPHIGGGMNAIQFNDDGSTLGAACWRADGVPIGLGGGPARPGTRFWPDRTRPKPR
jgi:gamma-glutamyltranspeptidase/glutathione hydrolase